MNKIPEALRLAEWWEQQSHNHALTPESKTAAELRRLHAVNKELIKALQACADEIQHEIWNSGEDEDENVNTKGQVLLVKKARKAIAKAEGEQK